MESTVLRRSGNRRRFVSGGLGACMAAVAALATSALAAPPLNPLNCPLYNFDAQSPKVQAGLFRPDDLLQCAEPDPLVVFSGQDLGLGQPGDAINALSNATSSFSTSQSYALLFTVDRQTVGAAPPDEFLRSRGVPFNVADQAAKGHQAGDQYMSLDVFTFGSAIAGTIAGSGSNNSEVRNNFNEGGVSFSSDPDKSASESGTGDQDNVDSTSGTAVALSVAGGDQAVYYSVRSDSPSLSTLPQGSGASIYRIEVGTPGATPALFVSFVDLGLDQFDDIDAMVVVDQGVVGAFDSQDRVFFSLTPESPSLSSIPGRSSVGAAADAYVASSDGVLQVVAGAEVLGLGAASDNVVGLDLLPCVDGIACALDHGIRADDVPTVSEWGLAALALMLLAAGSIVVRRGDAGSQAPSIF